MSARRESEKWQERREGEGEEGRTYVIAQRVAVPLYVELRREENWSLAQPWQSTGIQRSAEPVSMSTVRLCGGEPKSSGP